MGFDFDLNVSIGSDGCENPNDDPGHNLHAGESDVANEDSTSSLENVDHAIEKRLEVGSVLESLDDVYELYCEYARWTGFTVEKGSQLYFLKTSEVRMKVYNCSCEGYPDNERSLKDLAVYKKQVTRTNCKARLRVVREVEGPWTVSEFVKEHNHELLPPDQSYLLRSARKLICAKKSILEALNIAGIGVSRACKFTEKESGGLQNMDFTRKDAYARIRITKMETKVENGDAYAILRFFIDKSKDDPFFYWNVQLDDDGRLMNFFFRDSHCAIDYEFFGDVISFDTTYRTNKYNLICAPFVGINHHRRNVMFGLSFLSNETTKSFEWLFESFLESMNGKEPQVIYSDQCPALINSVDCTFKTAKHRLSQWHINQNAPSHFGLLDGDSTFKKMWYHCMNGCESIEEFECTWKNMVSTYDLSERRWFTTMYNLRSSWASVFTDKRFSAGLVGLHATSRTLVTNTVLKDLCTSNNSLYESVILYEQIQTDWRTRESADDALCCGVARQFVKHNRLLAHAANVYTHAVYKCFEFEAAYSLNVNVIQRPSDYSVDDLEFLVTTNGPSTRLRHVFFNKVTNHASCSCHMWETEGIFCRHILNIYFLMNVKSLPEQYMLRRWSKNAKTRILENLSSQSRSHGQHFVTDMVYVNQVMRMTYNRAQESKNHAECRSLIIQRLGDLINELSAKKRDVPVAAPDCGCFSTMLLDKPRGYPNNRLRRLYWDVCQNRGKKKARGGLSGRPLTLNNNTEGTNRNGKATEIDAIRNEAFYATQNSSGGYGASGRYMEELSDGCRINHCMLFDQAYICPKFLQQLRY